MTASLWVIQRLVFPHKLCQISAELPTFLLICYNQIVRASSPRISFLVHNKENNDGKQLHLILFMCYPKAPDSKSTLWLNLSFPLFLMINPWASTFPCVIPDRQVLSVVMQVLIMLTMGTFSWFCSRFPCLLCGEARLRSNVFPPPSHPVSSPLPTPACWKLSEVS